MSEESIQYRKPTTDEKRLLKVLIQRANLALPVGWLEAIQVHSMSDGGMGSFRIITTQSAAMGTFGERAAEIIFKDVDGVEVIASLNLDLNKAPMEVDLWKTDFSKLIYLPENL